LQEQADFIKNMRSQLSERDRSILHCFYLQEQTEEQICREMSPTATQFRLHKSRAKARFGAIGQWNVETPGPFSWELRSMQDQLTD
jgi:RNA polymerase sigma-70 factor, ECF subfamily